MRFSNSFLGGSFLLLPILSTEFLSFNLAGLLSLMLFQGSNFSVFANAFVDSAAIILLALAILFLPVELLSSTGVALFPVGISCIALGLLPQKGNVLQYVQAYCM